MCESVKAGGRKCGTEIEVHIIGDPPDDIYLRHGGCSGTMRRKGGQPLKKPCPVGTSEECSDCEEFVDGQWDQCPRWGDISEVGL